MSELRITDCLPTLLIGEKLGAGYSRDVYEYYPDPTKVIKVARAGIGIDGITANITEFELWQRVIEGKFYEQAKSWLCPCFTISEDGVYLIQARTVPVRFDELPELVPRWATDLKRSNAGMLAGKIVLHDYALNLCLEQGLKKHKLVETKWWDE